MSQEDPTFRVWYRILHRHDNRPSGWMLKPVSYPDEATAVRAVGKLAPVGGAGVEWRVLPAGTHPSE